eukprot:COSAG02_NODE_5075_length_4661_cov_4.005261_5_plen_77_part_00
MEQTDTTFINTRLHTTIQHRTSVRLQKLRYRPYYARRIVSIMPGLTWRDNEHKGIMPCVRGWGGRTAEAHRSRIQN